MAIERLHHDAPRGATDPRNVSRSEDVGCEAAPPPGRSISAPRGAEAQPSNETCRTQNANAAERHRGDARDTCGNLISNVLTYFTASIAFITSSSPEPSTFAVPGSSARLANTSVPDRAKVTVSCLFSPKLTVTTSAGDLSDG